LFEISLGEMLGQADDRPQRDFVLRLHSAVLVVSHPPSSSKKVRGAPPQTLIPDPKPGVRKPRLDGPYDL